MSVVCGVPLLRPKRSSLAAQCGSSVTSHTSVVAAEQNYNVSGVEVAQRQYFQHKPLSVTSVVPRVWSSALHSTIVAPLNTQQPHHNTTQSQLQTPHSSHFHIYNKHAAVFAPARTHATATATSTTAAAAESGKSGNAVKDESGILGSKCFGCGSVLQSDDPSMLGYVPPPSQIRGPNYKPANYRAKKDFTDLFKREFEEVMKENEKILQQTTQSDPQLAIKQQQWLQQQSKTKNKKQKEGEEKLARGIICQRCFSLKYHGKVLPVKVPIQQFRENLANLRTSEYRVVVVKIVDIFDFEGSVIDNFEDIVGTNNPIVLVGNKVDLLPQGASEDRVMTWLRRAARQRGLTKKLEQVFLVSALNGTGMKALISYISRLAFRERIRDVFVIGCSNSGKSTLVNRIINHLKANDNLNLTSTSSHQSDNSNDDDENSKQDDEEENEDKKKKSREGRDIEVPSEELHLNSGSSNTVTTVSSIPGTTLNIIAVPFRRSGRYGRYLYDTPGIFNWHQLFNWLTPTELAYVLPKKKIKPVVHFLHEGTTIFLGGLARLDYISGPPAYFTVFVAHTLYVHVTKTINADDVYKKHVGGLLHPPLSIAQRRKRGEIVITNNNNNNSSNNSVVEGVATVADENDVEFPPLTHKQEWQITGTTWRHAAADLVFAGLGWVSVTAKGNFLIHTKTPDIAAVLRASQEVIPTDLDTATTPASDTNTNDNSNSISSSSNNISNRIGIARVAANAAAAAAVGSSGSGYHGSLGQSIVSLRQEPLMPFETPSRFNRKAVVKKHRM